VGFRGLAKELLSKPDIDFQLRATQDYIPAETEDFLREKLLNNGLFSRLGVAVGYPIIMKHLSCRYEIAYSMYEADDIPEEWKSYVAKADEVWVPSQFCADVFGKYNKRIRIVPWGIDTELFVRPQVKHRNEEFVFGAIGVQSGRKGTDVLLRAFQSAFGGRPGVKLVIKTRDTRNIPAFDNAQVEVIDENWPEARLVEFVQGLDCLVEPSRGEGQGMPPLQAAACGVPSLVTGWSGMLDYADGKGVYPIRVSGLVKVKDMTAHNARWAEPDCDHLVELMQWVVEERPQVTGDYSRWSLRSMGAEFHRCIKQSWQRATG